MAEDSQQSTARKAEADLEDNKFSLTVPIVIEEVTEKS